jgi:hypothetical protein
MVDVVEGLYNFPVPHFSWKAGEKAVTDGSKRGLKQVRACVFFNVCIVSCASYPIYSFALTIMRIHT